VPFGADIVVSSSRRQDLNLHALREFLKCEGVKADIIGCTPWHPILSRAGEIQFYLDEHPSDIAAWVVLDDDPEVAEELSTRTVLVNERFGLTIQDAQKAARILSLFNWPTSLHLKK